jgi:aspartate racemase
VPSPADRAVIDRVVFEELVHGIILESSRAAYVRIVTDAVATGAEGVILGCTEISLLITPDLLSVPCFDTTALHAQSAVTAALARAG